MKTEENSGQFYKIGYIKEEISKMVKVRLNVMTKSKTRIVIASEEK